MRDGHRFVALGNDHIGAAIDSNSLGDSVAELMIRQALGFDRATKLRLRQPEMEAHNRGLSSTTTSALAASNGVRLGADTGVFGSRRAPVIGDEAVAPTPLRARCPFVGGR